MKKALIISMLVIFALGALGEEEVDLSKYKFVPGEKVIIFQDFSDIELGGTPEAGWEINGVAEVMEIEGKKWLKMEEDTELIPTYRSYPEELTIEFYLYGRNLYYEQMMLTFENEEEEYESKVEIGYDEVRWRGYYGDKELPHKAMEKTFYGEQSVVPVAMTIENGKMTLYVNRIRAAVVSGFFPVAVEKITFEAGVFSEEDENNLIAVTGIRIATGIPKVADAILKEGRYISHGIHFAVDSAEIRPESYSVLKEVAETLKAIPELRLRIVGHTDSTGTEEYNERLSLERAEAVKNYIISEFGIEGTMLETDGKGEAEPMADNSTPEGRAANRRVEFIKI